MKARASCLTAVNAVQDSAEASPEAGRASTQAGQGVTRSWKADYSLSVARSLQGFLSRPQEQAWRCSEQACWYAVL